MFTVRSVNLNQNCHHVQINKFFWWMRIWCRALRNQVKVLVCFCLSNACPPSAGLLLPGDWWPFSLFSKRSPMLRGAEADTRGRTEGSAPENQEHTCFILKFYHSPGSQWVDQTSAQGLFSLLLKGFLIIPCLLLTHFQTRPFPEISTSTVCYPCVDNLRKW